MLLWFIKIKHVIGTSCHVGKCCTEKHNPGILKYRMTQTIGEKEKHESHCRYLEIQKQIESFSPVCFAKPSRIQWKWIGQQGLVWCLGCSWNPFEYAEFPPRPPSHTRQVLEIIRSIVDRGFEKTWTWTEPFRGVEPFWFLGILLYFLAFLGMCSLIIGLIIALNWLINILGILLIWFSVN